MKKFVSLLLALLLCTLAFSACSKSDSDDQVIAKIENREIRLQEFLEGLDYWLYLYGIDASSKENQSYVEMIAEGHFESLILSEVVLVKGEELGFFDLSEEEKAQVEKSVKDEMDYGKNTIRSQLEEDYPDLSTAEIDLKLEIALTEQGYIEEDFEDYYTESLVYDKVYEYFTKDLSVTDEELKKEYDNLVAEAMESYAGDPSAFENAYLDGEAAYYTPAGYRRVKHILIGFDEDTQTELATLYYDGEDEAYDAALEEALAAVHDEAEEVLSSIETGAKDFETLMKEVTDDGGLTSYPDGYMVGKEGVSYDQNFRDAAFALAKVGDMSGLVAGSNGYHIIRLEEITEEAVTPLEEVEEELRKTLLSTKQEDAFYELAEQWKEEYSVKTYDEVYIAYLDKYFAGLSEEEETSPSASE